MALAPQLDSNNDLSAFWNRVKSYVPTGKPAESLFEKAATVPGGQSAEQMDARGRQAFLIARIAAVGMGGR
ncbi:hypothetical protein DYI23_15825 [Roseibium polysiphoniae]|uniref:Uncharacterized protein n=1 Tax=Roseibium polysiphoniae TaxID=2571221 RepID=A0A944GUK2_9HYPH|nr:hypothetical protein [Roseibium polysiphoniae]MBS8261696.1 hypothetical protein [Roseibium polysiphoniae]